MMKRTEGYRFRAIITQVDRSKDSPNSPPGTDIILRLDETLKDDVVISLMTKAGFWNVEVTDET
jgi:hypothetical protein